MGLPPVSIRVATTADAPALATLGAVTFHEAYRDKAQTPDLEAYVAEHYTPAQLAAVLAQPEVAVWLAESAKEAVGFLELRRAPVPPPVPGNQPLKLNRLYLRQHVWGHGVGTRLMELAMAAGVRGGHDVLWLSVWDQNPAAVRFYERWGFRTVGTELFVVGEDRSTDLLMVCALPAAAPGR